MAGVTERVSALLKRVRKKERDANIQGANASPMIARRDHSHNRHCLLLPSGKPTLGKNSYRGVSHVRVGEPNEEISVDTNNRRFCHCWVLIIVKRGVQLMTRRNLSHHDPLPLNPNATVAISRRYRSNCATWYVFNRLFATRSPSCAR